MEYFLFSYPNCQNCRELKEYLCNSGIPGKEYLLTQRESKIKIREFLKIIKRDEKGGIILPTLILKDEEREPVVLNDKKDLRDWLESRG